MKKSVSNPSTTQALHTQMVQLLPVLTAKFLKMGYAEISHQRLSQQNNNNTTSYQGLTRAQHPQFARVMIKWALKLDKSSKNLSNLSHEIAVLKAVNLPQNPTDKTIILAPPLLLHNKLQIIVFEKSQQLTMLVMPYYPQGSLANLLNNKKVWSLSDPFLSSQKQQLIIQAAYLIANLHKQGWLHNDIKPSNILLERSFPLDGFSLSNTNAESNANDGHVTPQLLLTDFALAQRFDETDITNTAGTPAYLAPERWQGQGATEQSDVYAFGIMMYEILTGARPFKVTTQSSNPLKDWALEHCQQPVQTLPKKYQCYQLIINKALAKRTGRRYGSMEELLKDLERLRNH